MPGRLLQALQQILHEHLVASTQALGDGCIAVYHGNTTHLLVDGPATFAAALVDAAQRGVDVRLVLPGRSDFELVPQAGRTYYDRLLPADVCIHEMDDAVMHAKTAVIDGVVSTVGSSNIDWRSFVANHEINAVVLGRDFALQVHGAGGPARRTLAPAYRG